jgi:hypothetical protein
MGTAALFLSMNKALWIAVMSGARGSRPPTLRGRAEADNLLSLKKSKFIRKLFLQAGR